ncbi:hypothetical protein LEP1GSC007_1551 [Leptospira interrogans serovar Bulgarica str. Mallika]|nr:hypothetical protein LEP1GSC007_1551 [Leptospira interrogans serovar Bulgarica str. Mallika]
MSYPELQLDTNLAKNNFLVYLWSEGESLFLSSSVVRK